jgi:hypothetical protein
MNWLAYGVLLEVAGVTDEGQRGVTTADLDTLFKAANFEVTPCV